MFEKQPSQGNFKDEGRVAAQQPGRDIMGNDHEQLMSIAEIRAAMRTLLSMGYSYKQGAAMWRPPSFADLSSARSKADIAERDRQFRDVMSPAEADAAERESLAYRIEDLAAKVRAISNSYSRPGISVEAVEAVEKSLRARVEEIESLTRGRLTGFQSLIDKRQNQVTQIDALLGALEKRVETIRGYIVKEGTNYGGEPLVDEIQKMRGWAGSVNESMMLSAQNFAQLRTDIDAVRELNAQTAARVTATEDRHPQLIIAAKRDVEETIQGTVNETGRALAGVHKRLDSAGIPPL